MSENALQESFSAQPRADGDEASSTANESSLSKNVSVLNREPMGMKHDTIATVAAEIEMFQCSTASRWG